ncbi:anti-sigma regulatory factor (Ser/Thr protein kinase) [Natranaerovirga hydrolytica]|uniref:Anti-sigma regulatory factor (Ser/Thr protein kinase) n=1 Tax=Natranaerovirga hydrolytica TaxID=680378 RepID=A0A4R1N617_9FIRM|nr:anti-sigma regulatory factor (Ser/Thr protein kinase) [Natranaerovirga hydrolytica]
MNFHYEVLEDEFTHAGVASTKVKKTLKQLGLSPDIIRKVAIAMYEAEINMVIHAQGGFIDVEITPEEVYIVLEDNGPGIEDIELAMKAGYSTASDKAREMGFGAGMGLPNIKRNSDHLSITSKKGEGTKVEITIYL